MIVNLIAIDPLDDSRILQYRVPENSREMEVLRTALEAIHVEHTILASAKVKARYKSSPKESTDV